jgi:hypothetical protein
MIIEIDVEKMKAAGVKIFSVYCDGGIMVEAGDYHPFNDAEAYERWIEQRLSRQAHANPKSSCLTNSGPRRQRSDALR